MELQYKNHLKNLVHATKAFKQQTKEWVKEILIKPIRTLYNIASEYEDENKEPLKQGLKHAKKLLINVLINNKEPKLEN